MMTELNIPYIIQVMVKSDNDANGSLKCTKKSVVNLPSIKTDYCGHQSIRDLGPKIWKLNLGELKEIDSLEHSKKKYFKFKKS